MLVLYLCVALGGTFVMEQAASIVIMEYSRFLELRMTVEVRGDTLGTLSIFLVFLMVCAAVLYTHVIL